MLTAPRVVRLALIAVLVLAAIGLAPADRAAAQPLPAPSPRVRTAASPPPTMAKAAVVLEAETGRVLYEKAAHERLPPASLTKMATAMVSLERADPERVVVATANSMAEPAVIGLDPGDRLPLREALFGLLMNSGNDVALAIAESIGNGSIGAYVGWMNALVRSLGLVDTRFANPHGLDIGEHYSSAYDMAIIGRMLLRQPLLRTIVSTQRHDYDAPPLWAFRNINRFLTAYPGADGLKTGYETRAGRCLAASATRNGRQIIVVVLNSDEHVADATALMDYGFSIVERAAPAPSPSPSPSPATQPRLVAAAASDAPNPLRGSDSTFDRLRAGS